MSINPLISLNHIEEREDGKKISQLSISWWYFDDDVPITHRYICECNTIRNDGEWAKPTLRFLSIHFSFRHKSLPRAPTMVEARACACEHISLRCHSIIVTSFALLAVRYSEWVMYSMIHRRAMHQLYVRSYKFYSLCKLPTISGMSDNNDKSIISILLQWWKHFHVWFEFLMLFEKFINLYGHLCVSLSIDWNSSISIDTIITFGMLLIYIRKSCGSHAMHNFNIDTA